MGFLIDTSIWIAVERGKLSPAYIHKHIRQSPVYVSPINLAALTFGIGLMRDAKQKLRANAMLKRIRRKPLLRITGETGEIFGELAAKLERAGRGADFRVQELVACCADDSAWIRNHHCKRKGF
jgi:predicted nucleic acid-binding protein